MRGRARAGGASLAALLLAAGCATAGHEGPARDASLDAPSASGPPRSPEVGAAAAAEVAAMRSLATPGMQRPPVGPVAFRIADLPRAHVPRPLQQGDAVLTGDEASEVVVHRPRPSSETLSALEPAPVTVHVTGRQQPFGLLAVGDWRGWTGSVFGEYVGAYLSCYDRKAKIRTVPARWESLGVRPDGDAAYAVGDGWFDRMRCSGWVQQRSTATARLLLPGGLLYGFVDCQGDCAKRSLTLLFPRAHKLAASSNDKDPPECDVTAVSHVRIPLRPGAAASVLAQVMVPDLEDWLQGTRRWKKPPIVEDDHAVDRPVPGSVLLGVEITQGTDEAEPLGVAYRIHLDSDGRPTAALVPGERPSPAPSSAAKRPIGS